METTQVQTEAAKEAPVKVDELSAEERLSLAKIEIGKDYTAVIDVGGWRFKVTYPTVYEDQLIMVEEEKQYAGLMNPSAELKMSAIVWATLDVVVKEIWKVDGEQTPKRFRGSFSVVFKTLRNARKVYETIITPLYLKYDEFRGKLDNEVDPLKNG